MQTVIKKTAKHFRLNETLIKDAQKILGAKTETEAVETALSDVIYQEKMRRLIEQTKGKFKFEGLN
ncbi:MAG: type II toxin-antitoxin system VapB family antitoxin [Nitrospirae bacterium]|nr:type II toxin-antitoxin system VapB family antitoxin [Nitrospirota bacterium]MBI3377109.1 type II toxin-antitoxin system VapB family antitoxin [Nitrospirota bacterium]